MVELDGGPGNPRIRYDRCASNAGGFCAAETMLTVHYHTCRRLLDVGSAFVGREVMCPVCLGWVPVPFVAGVRAPHRRWGRWVGLAGVAVGAA